MKQAMHVMQLLIRFLKDRQSRTAAAAEESRETPIEFD